MNTVADGVDGTSDIRCGVVVLIAGLRSGDGEEDFVLIRTVEEEEVVIGCDLAFGVTGSERDSQPRGSSSDKRHRRVVIAARRRKLEVDGLVKLVGVIVADK